MKKHLFWKHLYFVFLFSILLITGCDSNSVTQAISPPLLLPATITSPVTPTIFPPFAKLSSGQYVVYYRSSDHAMYAVSQDTGIQEKYTDFSGMPVSPDGILFRWGYLIYNSATGNILDFSYAMGEKQCGVWSSSPDGKSFTLDCDGELYVLLLDSGAIVKISQRDAEYDHFNSPYWSPDGKWIAYIRLVANPDYAPVGEAQLFLVDTSCLSEPSTCPEKTYGPIKGDFSAAPCPYGWSPDSKFIAIPAFNSGILIYDIDTDQTRMLPYKANSVAWSPDGKWLAFEGYFPETSRSEEIFIVPVDGGDPIQITSEDNVDSSILFWVEVP